MKFNPGDKVRFLNEKGGGIIQKILSKTMVIVKTEDDFEYPEQNANLVLIEAAKIENQNEKTKVDEVTIKEEIVTEDYTDYKEDDKTVIAFAFVKKFEGEKEVFEAYLINDSNHHLFYHVVLKGDNAFEMLDADITDPVTLVKTANFSRDRINSGKEIIIQISFFGHKYDVLKDQIVRRIKIYPIKFFNDGFFTDNDYLDEKAYVFMLYTEKPGLGQSIKTEHDFEKLILEKDFSQTSEKSQTSKPHKKPETIECDLHIQNLVESVIGMTNHEILSIQMNHFHKQLTDAISNKAGKIVFIHGIGNGTLKNTLRESLSKQYKLHYEDASFREYGFGATMVIL